MLPQWLKLKAFFSHEATKNTKKRKDNKSPSNRDFPDIQDKILNPRLLVFILCILNILVKKASKETRQKYLSTKTPKEKCPRNPNNFRQIILRGAFVSFCDKFAVTSLFHRRDAMPDKINPEMRIAELVATYPESLSVFTTYGLEELVSEDALRLLAPFLTLGTALRTRGIPVDNFLRSLRQHLHDSAPTEAPGLHEVNNHSRLSLLGLLPCGLKVPFAKAVTSFFEQYLAEGNSPITYAVEGNVNQELSYYKFVDQVESVDELPDIIVSSDFNAFFYHRFRQRFIDQGHFVDVSPSRINSAFDGTGILDPLGQFTMLTVNPLIIVADLARIGTRPLPRCWSDLLDPMWHRSITLRGDRQFFCHAVLLPFFKEHGAMAITALARNVLRGQHPAQMVKEAGADRPDGAALYVMPDFFAHKITKTERVRIIWPEDGGLISPVTMLVKKQRATELKAITDFLAGPELAKVFAGAWFPTPHPDVNNALPPKARLKWLGWDYLRSNDLAEQNAAIDEIFLPVVQAAQS